MKTRPFSVLTRRTGAALLGGLTVWLSGAGSAVADAPLAPVALGLPVVPAPTERFEVPSPRQGGPVVRGSLGDVPEQQWLVGVQAEYAATSGSRFHTLDSNRIGIGVGYRNRSWGPHVRALISPNTEGYESLSGLVGVGLRAHFDLLGRPWSYGVGLHAEVRLRNHIWLTYATPLELGGLLLERGSLRVRLVGGVRRIAGGALVNLFLVDPNGFDNENARDDLNALKSRHPWQGFVAVEFSRVL